MSRCFLFVGGSQPNFRKAQRDVLMDTVDSETRSGIMSHIHGKDTVPEMAVRRLIYGMGYRYRLHDRSLPGIPDIVFRPHRKVIVVHGCFWHRHKRCRFATVRKTHTDYWISKFQPLGWKSILIWQ